jgi:CBS domain-containing protein
MTNRKLCDIVKDQKPLILPADTSLKRACQCMSERRAGSVLVIDDRQHLVGIVTGRDVVRRLACGAQADQCTLAETMTPNPVTVTPDDRAIDALRAMCDGGFRHVPVLENDRIWGVVSRADFKGMELDQLDLEEHLAECIR